MLVGPAITLVAELLSSVLRGSLFISFFPSSGVLAVGIAEHKLRNSLTARNQFLIRA